VVLEAEVVDVPDVPGAPLAVVVVGTGVDHHDVEIADNGQGYKTFFSSSLRPNEFDFFGATTPSIRRLA